MAMTLYRAGPWVVVDAPSNLGLRPPGPGSVPGADKAPLALREAGLHDRLQRAGAGYAGVVQAGRYVDDPGRARDEVRNQAAIIDHSLRLAERIGEVLDSGARPIVLGGDCGILLGAGIALRRRGGGAGLVHVDGHTDFRHPGNSAECASLAGEDLAAAIGRHWPAIANVNGLAPYFAAERVAHIGCRDDDEHLDEALAVLGAVVTAADAAGDGVAAAARARAAAGRSGGYWLHVDVDVLDPSVLSAVDSPEPGGLDGQQFVRLLQALMTGALGVQFTVFDPDRDGGGAQARMLADLIVAGVGVGGAA